MGFAISPTDLGLLCRELFLVLLLLGCQLLGLDLVFFIDACKLLLVSLRQSPLRLHNFVAKGDRFLLGLLHLLHLLLEFLSLLGCFHSSFGCFHHLVSGSGGVLGKLLSCMALRFGGSVGELLLFASKLLGLLSGLGFQFGFLGFGL